MTSALAENERRRAGLDAVRARGVDPFPHFDSGARRLIADIVSAHGATGNPEELQRACEYQLAGRLVARRKSGAATLLEIRDRSGTMRLRVRPEVSSAHAAEGMTLWDIGDIVTVTGRPQLTHGGAVGLEVESGRLLAKALQLNHGLNHLGHRSDRPEVDLMADAEHRRRFATRAALIAGIREWLNKREFVEVETPVLQTLAGGALARPFSTHHNALDQDVSLRISAELHLRRCTVGDIERVYELGSRFRNEGISARHNPEFTMLEWSMAYSDYLDSASLLEQLVADVTQSVLGGTRVTYRGTVIDLGRPWQRTTLSDAVETSTGLDIFAATSEQLLEVLPSAPAGTASWSDAVRALYAKRVEPRLIQPTIVVDFPADTHPCMKRSTLNAQLGEGFDVVLGGMEIASGGTELCDPDEQWLRFVEHGGSTNGREPHPKDREYVSALEYGAPPSSGAGLGIDRLLMILLDLDTIQETTIFSMSS